jgi:hypothetical protein
MILTTGNAVFDDICAPASGKSEFGMDTLTRKMMGDRSQLAEFLAGLHQGDVLVYNGADFYLQTWQPDESTPWATVTLLYKGLLAGFPETDIQTEFVTSAGSVSANYMLENPDPFAGGVGKGRIYNRRELSRSATIPGFYTADLVVPFSGGYILYKNVYTLGATMEFTYIACQSTYRYIAGDKPGAAAHDAIDIAYDPVIKRARIHTADGALFGIDSAANFDFAPGGTSAPVQLDVVVAFTSKHVIGSPYYECTDVVRRELVQPGI